MKHNLLFDRFALSTIGRLSASPSTVGCIVLGALLLAGSPAPAQDAPPPAAGATGAGPAQGGAITNREELLRQRALRLEARTNTPAVGTLTNAALEPRTSPRPIPAPNPGGIVNQINPAAPGALGGTTNNPAATQPGVAGAIGPDQIAIQPPPGSTNIPPEEMIPAGFIDFRGADIKDVLQIYAGLVNRTILRPSQLTGQQITLTTQTPLTKRETIQALDSVLGMNGITMMNFGDKFVKASQLATTSTEGAPFDKRDITQIPDFGSYVTHVVQLKYVKPSEMVQVLQPFAKIPNSILPIDASQMLVLRDFTENVKRMLEMIKEIDVSVPSEFVQEVIPIKYAKASEIANAINNLSTGGGGATIGGSTGGATPTQGTRSTGSRSGFGSQRSGGYGGSGGMYPGQNYPGMVPQGTTGGSPLTGGQPGGASSFTDRLRNIIQKASVTGDIQVLGQTKMLADERTNSLIIYASREDMKIIKDIVAKLDVVLAQVLIETVIIQVSLNDSRDLGVGYESKQTQGIGSYFNGIGALNPGKSLSLGNFLGGSSTTNGSGGSLPASGFSYLASFGQDLDVTLTAVASDSRAKILQRPRVQTSHNEPATIFVGESRPYPTASYYGGGAYGGYSSIQQLQIGVTLDVTPLINPDGLVVMDIHQRIESVNGTVNLPNVGDVPITSQKEAQAKISVKDHDTIILGGMIETTKDKSAGGVPYLKDIPLLGYLFRSTHEQEVRNELIVLIRPTVLPTPEVAALTANAEKAAMPGVSRAEKELRADEARRKKQADYEDEMERKAKSQ